MNEKEEKAFKAAYGFYAKWRETVIETDEEWKKWAVEWNDTFSEVKDTPIGLRLADAVLDAFGDLYRNGMKPLPANYFGRDDL